MFLCRFDGRSICCFVFVIFLWTSIVGVSSLFRLIAHNTTWLLTSISIIETQFPTKIDNTKIRDQIQWTVCVKEIERKREILFFPASRNKTRNMNNTQKVWNQANQAQAQIESQITKGKERKRLKNKEKWTKNRTNFRLQFVIHEENKD